MFVWVPGPIDRPTMQRWSMQEKYRRLLDQKIKETIKNRERDVYIKKTNIGSCAYEEIKSERNLCAREQQTPTVRINWEDLWTPA